jgi:hypothetical protein
VEPIVSGLSGSMRRTLLRLLDGGTNDVSGRPTRQRLAKAGLVKFVQPTDVVDLLLLNRWDWPIELTPLGKATAEYFAARRRKV